MSDIVAPGYVADSVVNEVVSFDEGEIYGGTYARIFFKNGYGVSVIDHSFSHGLEMAVLKGTRDRWELNYKSEVTSDVLTYLTTSELFAAIKQVSEL